MNNDKQKKDKLTIGWREWLALPALDIPAIKAKIDTGAHTSALHAFRVEPFRERGQPMVRFGVHPLQGETDPEIFCQAALVDQRQVTNSGGQRELRYVIQTSIRLGNQSWKIEITLTDRETMRYRMLLGRTALRDRLLVDPGRSFLMGRGLARAYDHHRPNAPTEERTTS